MFRYGTLTHDTFKKMGVPYVKPWPFIGSMHNIFLRVSAIKFIKMYICLAKTLVSYVMLQITEVFWEYVSRLKFDVFKSK